MRSFLRGLLGKNRFGSELDTVSSFYRIEREVALGRLDEHMVLVAEFNKTPGQVQLTARPETATLLLNRGGRTWALATRSKRVEQLVAMGRLGSPNVNLSVMPDGSVLVKVVLERWDYQVVALSIRSLPTRD